MTCEICGKATATRLILIRETHPASGTPTGKPAWRIRTCEPCTPFKLTRFAVHTETVTTKRAIPDAKP